MTHNHEVVCSKHSRVYYKNKRGIDHFVEDHKVDQIIFQIYFVKITFNHFVKIIDYLIKNYFVKNQNPYR